MQIMTFGASARGTWRWRSVALAAAVWLCWPLPAAAQPWVPTDISVFGGAASGVAYGVSDNGTVVGTYPGTSGTTRGFIWTGGNGWTDPGTFGGTYTQPTAVNNANEVVGYSYLPGNVGIRAFRWTA